MQGVFFRVHTQEKATELDLTGFVQNEANGDVYIEAEGPYEKLVEFSDWCKIGSPSAEVKHVEISEGELKNFSGEFLINR